MTLRRLIGLARSLAIYRAMPFRSRRLRRLYAQFVSPGDLAFDIGAHAGNRTRALLAVGCRVVALEPHPTFAGLLRAEFARAPRVVVEEVAVAREARLTDLLISDAHPAVSTIDRTWREARAREAGFSAVRWNRTCRVTATTLDAMILRHGVPRFIKLDVEGAEEEALAGLSTPIQALSFEYLPSAPERVAACVAGLAALGSYRFNLAIGESHRLALGSWVDGDALVDAITRDPARRRSGDVYAQRAQTST
jgi:FkbM family methyltransferase